MFARKWGIGVDKAKRTFKDRTQNNVISTLKPLKQGHRTDFMSQRRHRNNYRFYTDTLFSKDKSIFGNTCDQIFTDGDYVKIISMRYKSETGTTLYRINQDIGVSNKIFMDNAVKQNGYKTQMKRVERLAIMEV